MPRPRTVAIGLLACLLAVAPFVPRGGGDDDEGAITPSGGGDRLARTAGFGSVSASAQAEIDRVVAGGRTLGRTTQRGVSGFAPVPAAAEAVRCADFEGQTYCLGVGWTEDSPSQVQARISAAARAVARTPGAQRPEETGDLDALATLRQSARLSPAARAAQDREELTMAARSVAKVWLLRHQIQGEPLPAGFLDRHPEARASSGNGPAKPGTAYPERSVILSTQRVAEQERTYWCGPGAMQMITWGWKKKDRGQAHWADLLGTTTAGTAITSMVRVVNNHTGWDRPAYAGPYVTLDIGDWGFARWKLLIMRHIADYRAPVVLHPILHKRYYPYLDDDASGHFQVGRGYDKRGPRTDAIGYFEPWNQARFDPSEPSISRVQWRSAYKSFRANKDHFQHNIGV